MVDQPERPDVPAPVDDGSGDAVRGGGGSGAGGDAARDGRGASVDGDAVGGGGDAVQPRASRGGRNLPLAIGSAVAFAVLFLGSAYISDLAMLALVAVVFVIAIAEIDTALRTTGARPPTAVVLAVGLVMLPATYWYGPTGQIVALGVMMTGVMMWALLDSADPAPLRSAGSGTLMALWVPFLGSFLALLLRRPDGEWYVILTVALTAASDIFAYAVGYRFGRNKLAPAVSPGKTWEGVIGGVVGAAVVAAIIGPLMVDQLPIGLAMLLGALVSVVAVIGDLAESSIKRSLGVKDFGRLLPGHGGMMDRVDAMLFTLPVAHLVLLAGRL